MATIALSRAYQSQFEAHPSLTLAATNGTLTAFADIVAQTAQILLNSRDKPPHEPEFEPPRPHYDPYRTLRFAAFGVAMGPLIGRWNQFLEHSFPLRSSISPAVSRYPRSGQGGRRQVGKVSLVALGKRVACDQTIMAPTGLVFFIGSMGLMEGRDRAGIKQKYQDMFTPALIANWKVWPAIQLINFRFMPLPYRVPFQATCGVFWTLYLSLLNAREDKVEDEREWERNKI